jgi:hypothetical protein
VIAFKRATLVSLVCVTTLGLTGVGTTAYAADVKPVAASASSVDEPSEEVTEEQINELARYLQAIEQGELVGANGKFDYEGTAARFGSDFAAAVKSQIESQREASGGIQTRSKYTSCLLKSIGVGGLGNAIGAITNKLSEKKWSDAARLITKEAAKRGIKIAVRGGVAGLAAGLAAGAILCATPWA